MRWKIASSFLAIAFTIIAICISPLACRKEKKQEDTVEALHEILKNAGLEDDIYVQQRLEKALSNLKNNVGDPEPILIAAAVGKIQEDKQAALLLVTYDEDGDIIGFGIKEKFVNVDVSQGILLEEYPAFVYRRPCEYFALPWPPVKIRDSGQRKSAPQWQKYVTGDGIDTNKIKTTSYWRETLPPIWLSIPDPNKVKVDMYLYDAAGHKSQPVKLHCLPGHFPQREN